MTSLEKNNQMTGRNLKISLPGGGGSKEEFISYDYINHGENSGSINPIVYLPGLVRQKNEAKSINLQQLCKKGGTRFLGADYYGVGRSSGKFSDGTLSRWTDDTIYLIESILGTKEKVILVGHGLGAWIAFLIARKRPELIGGIVGMSADADFTEELLWKNLDDDVKEKIMSGMYEITWGTEKYAITRNLIEDGRKNLLLTGGPGSIDVSCPVRLLHAFNDEEVPYQMALKLLENVKAADASITLMKDATHVMEGEEEFKYMRTYITQIMNAFKGDYDLRSPAS